MPPKRDKRKTGGASGNGGGNSTPGRRTTRGHNNATGAGANGVGSAAPSKRVTTPKPEGTGRNTNNSRGKRRVAANRAPAAPTAKRATGKRVGTRGNKKEKELTSFKDENGEVYKTGGESERSVCCECFSACVLRDARRARGRQATISYFVRFSLQILPMWTVSSRICLTTSA